MRKCYCFTVLLVFIFTLICVPVTAEETLDSTGSGGWSVGQYVDDFGDPTGKTYLYTRISGTFSNTATDGSDLSVVVSYEDKQFTVRLLEYNDTKALYTDQSKITLKFKVDDVIYTHYLNPSAPPNGDLVISDLIENMAEVKPSDSAGMRLAKINQERRAKNSAVSLLTALLAAGTNVRCVIYIDSSKYSFTIGSDGFGDAVFGEMYAEAEELFEKGNYEEAMAAFQSCGSYKDSAARIGECIANTYGPLADQIEKLQNEESLSLADAIAVVKADPSRQDSEGSESFMEKLEELAECEGIYQYVSTQTSTVYPLTIFFRVVSGTIHADITFDAWGGTFEEDLMTQLPEENEYNWKIDTIRRKDGYDDVYLCFWVNNRKILCEWVGMPSEANMECYRTEETDQDPAGDSAEDAEKELLYEKGISLEKAGKKAEANGIFAALGDYRDSENHFDAHYCSASGSVVIRSGIAPVQYGEYYVFLTEEGKPAFTGEWDWVGSSSNGMMAVMKDGKRGYITAGGELAVSLVWDAVTEFSKDGTAFVYKKTDKSWSEIDKSGKVLRHHLDNPSVYAKDQEDGVWISFRGMYMDNSEKVVLSGEWERGDDFFGDYAVVYKDEKYGVIDREGNYIYPCIYDSIGNAGTWFVLVEDGYLNIKDASGNILY